MIFYSDTHSSKTLYNVLSTKYCDEERPRVKAASFRVSVDAVLRCDLVRMDERQGVRDREPGGTVRATCPHKSGAVEVVPPQLFIALGTVGSSVLPKLAVVGHKGKLHMGTINGRKHRNT